MLLGFPSVYLWIAILVFTVAIEAFTLTLVSIWFSVGALAALIAASLGMGIAGQIMVFVVVSALLLLMLRPFSRKFLRIRNEHTNADRIIGQTAIVATAIDNMASLGEVVLMGQHWTARSKDGTQISAGSEVRVVAISGVKAIVEPIYTPDVNKHEEE